MAPFRTDLITLQNPHAVPSVLPKPDATKEKKPAAKAAALVGSQKKPLPCTRSSICKARVA